MPDPIVTLADGGDPEHEAIVAESVGLAMQVVLDLLPPAERVAFVLHDVFAVPFDDIAVIVDRTPEAARQLASRARRRVQGEAFVSDTDVTGQRAVVDAFFAAARDGDFDALVAVLDPDVVLRSDGGAGRPSATVLVRGAAEVASRALTFARLSPHVRPALVNGAAGVVVAPGGRPFSVMAFTVAHGRIVAIDSLADPDRLARLDLPELDAEARRRREPERSSDRRSR
jgi:RNA polymerase sigma-70 factor (ECF subfamily)